jgi:HEAT repeat protein
MKQRIVGLLITVLILGCAPNVSYSKIGEVTGTNSTQNHSVVTQPNHPLSNRADASMNNQDTTANSLDDLKARLYSTDQDTSSLALAELIRLGRQATPVLLEALTHSTPRTRRLAAEGLSEIADPISADALFQATHDSNGEVRARAATALYRLRDERALPALVATLNDYPDILHNPYTASMYPLMQGGREVLPLVIPLLQSPDDLTRERAFLIVEAVVTKLPQGQNWSELWRRLGSYDPAAPQVERDRSAEQWEEWLKQL